MSIEADRIVFSTDVAPFGGIRKASKIYGGLTPDGKYELIAFRPAVFMLGRAGDLGGASIFGIHGPVGVNKRSNLDEKMKAGIIDLLMPPIKDVITLAERFPSAYLLFHETVSFDEGVVAALKGNPNKIFIENSPVKDSFGQTIETIEDLRQEGLNAGLMFDYVHYMREDNGFDKRTIANGNFKLFWREIHEKLKDVADTVPCIGIHLPIGANGDSLPVNLMDEDYWKDFAKLIDFFGDKFYCLVFENQSGLNPLKTKRQEKEARARVRLVLDTMYNFGIVF